MENRNERMKESTMRKLYFKMNAIAMSQPSFIWNRAVAFVNWGARMQVKNFFLFFLLNCSFVFKSNENVSKCSKKFGESKNSSCANKEIAFSYCVLWS